jgi:hypothetical protein
MRENRLVVDTNKLVEALGKNGGIVKAVTDDETVTVYVMNGHVMVYRADRDEPITKVLAFDAR